MRALFRHLRGIVVFGGFTLNTILCFVPILLLAIIKLLTPVAAVRRGITRILMSIGEVWISINSVILHSGASIDWRATGLENLRRDEWYLILSNHLSWIDILVLQKTLNRRIPFLKFFIKQELIWFPLLGITWWAMDMPFMKRFSASYLAANPHMKGKDLETTRRACEKFSDTPTSVLNFIEGTRFSEEKRAARKSPYKNLLQPRAGGLAIALSSMGELFTSVVDVTLIYPRGAISFWSMCCGEHVDVVVDVRERPLDRWLVEGSYESDREFRKRVHSWLAQIWTEKDEILEKMKESHGR
jgi:1-acyl-sn-glycerol-3-phosphate acyltransferase